MHLHWHRRDLRLADNPALASRPGEGTVGVFVLDPAILAHSAPPRTSFLLDALETLESAYGERDGTVLILEGSPAVQLPELATTLDASIVTWGEDYSGLARERDARVRDALPCPVETTHQAVLHEPGTITTNEGGPYKVFTYFSRKWHDRPKDDPTPAPDGSALLGPEALERDDPADIPSHEGIDVLDGIPGLADLDVARPEADIPSAGTAAARERLADFCESPIYRYADDRDYPANGCTSRLSSHLTYGTIGIREVWDATERAREGAPDESGMDSVVEFQDQLAWREFYVQVLRDRPDTVSRNYKDFARPVNWRRDPDALQAWKDGETGYPIVDAGMRQLRAEAFMHNRLRMVVASFLTKDLHIDWREGYAWFREKLVDHDTANDVGGWQWAASTGTDAQPYFRVFNPMTQGERFDPDAEYIGRYVPELAAVPADVIHSWDTLDAAVRESHAPEYPAPIVDHAERREEAITMFEEAREG